MTTLFIAEKPSMARELAKRTAAFASSGAMDIFRTMGGIGDSCTAVPAGRTGRIGDSRP